ncbi:MAG: hypothetical protein VX343_04165 [Thermodesulfobacteriota bacterium]|nr:hypothetical protein [Thermodesulfobacteriota bacterium]
MNLKVILMTKDDKELIEPWLLYHGERVGYENLHIVDDSTDLDIINFYKNHAHLNFNLHRDLSGHRNLNNMEGCFAEIQKSISENDVYFLKMDTDEFLVHIEDEKISCDISQVKKAIDIENENFSIPNDFINAKLDYLKSKNTNLLEGLHFYCNKRGNYKRTFSKSEHINLGGHVKSLTNKSKNLNVLHFRYKRFEDHFDLAKKVCVSHNYINEYDDDQTIIKKLSVFSGPSCNSNHKSKFVHDSLLHKDFKEKYYQEHNNKSQVIFYDGLHNWYKEKSDQLAL